MVYQSTKPIIDIKCEEGQIIVLCEGEIISLITIEYKVIMKTEIKA